MHHQHIVRTYKVCTETEDALGEEDSQLEYDPEARELRHVSVSTR